MSLLTPITFVAAVNDKEILRKNLLSSPCVSSAFGHQLLLQEGFLSASKAYNDAIDRVTNDVIVFVHQDVYLPQSWVSDLQIAIRHLEEKDPRWGVLGCWGVTKKQEERGYLYTTRWGVVGQPFPLPVPIRTLDEVILIVRKSAGLRFDEGLPHYHFYGTDLCMTAAARGLCCYAISAFCVHNTNQISVYPKEFYECYQYVKRAWMKSLPIQTPCVKISRYDTDVRKRRLKELCFRVFDRQRLDGTPRVADPTRILAELKTKGY